MPVPDVYKRQEAKVAIWYGSNEPNMKKAMQKLKRAYPNAQDHPFAGYLSLIHISAGVLVLCMVLQCIRLAARSEYIAEA